MNGKGKSWRFTIWRKISDWAKSDSHNAFIDHQIQVPYYYNTRRKVDYSLDKDSNGKTKSDEIGYKRNHQRRF
jgi:hypothetical protein